jgi:hypothetical protein
MPACSSFSITVNIVDEGGSTASVSIPVQSMGGTPTATGGSIQTVEGLPFSGSVADFSSGLMNAQPGNFNVQVTWSNGQISTGALQANGSCGGFDVLISSLVFPEEGTYSGTVTITDSSGATTTATVQAQVADASLTASTATITAT